MTLKLNIQNAILRRLTGLLGACAVASLAITSAHAAPVSPKEGLGAGISLGGYSGANLGFNALYATKLQNSAYADRIGLEFAASYASGSDLGIDTTYVGAGVYGTYRFALSDDVDLIGQLGLQYIGINYETDTSDASGNFFAPALGAAAEFEIDRASAVRAQLRSFGALDIIYVIRR